MVKQDIRSTDTITSTAEDFEVDDSTLEGINANKETIWSNTNFQVNWNYYDTIEEIKKSINNFVTFITGQGFTAESTRDKYLLENIRGAGEETFNSIMWNAKVMSKINGGSYTHIIRNKETGTLINLKALSPLNMRTIYDEAGIIIRHEQISNVKGKLPKTFKPNEIFYIMNDKVGDSISGQAVPANVKWTVDAWQEALADKRRMLHLSTVRVLYVEEDDKTRYTEIKRDYAAAIKDGTVIIIPGKPGDAGFQDLTAPSSEHIEFIRMLENKFYKAVGFPKSLTGDAEGIPESGGKMARVNFEPTYLREVVELEADIWNQLGIKGTFGRQPSITEGVADTANKSNNQTQATQPSDSATGGI